MKMIFSILLITMSFTVYAQNVGIGTTTPTEKLDVNGNLNVQGNIKINGTAGQEGQILMTNNTGATVWGQVCDLKNIRTYISSGSFTIPSGVTELFVEVWSGGGGGAAGGGGGGGGYAAVFLSVGAATTATIVVGVGGTAALSPVSNAGNGATSTFTVNGQTISVYGGQGGGSNYGGNGGLVPAVLASDDYFHVDGQSGYSSTETYSQRTSTQFVTSVNYGNGGNAAYAPGTGGHGAFKSFDTNAPATTIKINESTNPGRPGGGGGIYNGSNYGSNGATGMVVIRY